MSKIDIDTKIEKALTEIEKLKIEESDLVFEKLLGDMVFDKELSVIEMSIFKYIKKYFRFF